jgi:hypothetical protein
MSDPLTPAPEPYAPEAPAAAPAAGDPIIMTVGQSATVTLSFIDGLEDKMGPMAATSAGSVSVDVPNVVNATASVSGGTEAKVTVRMEAVNLGKANVQYRCGDVALAWPVEVIRREAKSVVVDYPSLIRAPL